MISYHALNSEEASCYFYGASSRGKDQTARGKGKDSTLSSVRGAKLYVNTLSDRPLIRTEERNYYLPVNRSRA